MLRNGVHKLKDALVFATGRNVVPVLTPESASEFHALVDSAPLVIWTTNPQGECTFISRFWKTLTGRDPECDLGYRWCQALHPEDQARAASDLTAAIQNRGVCVGEYRVRRVNRHYAWVLDRGVPYFDQHGEFAGHIGTCVDISARKTLDAKIDILVLGMEAERKRIARELHDDIGQKLALLGVALSEIEHLLKHEAGPIKKKVRQTRDLLGEIASDTHLISHNLHPAVLMHLGLLPALRRLCNDFSAQKKVYVEFDGDSPYDDPSSEVSTALFRIAQECLSNVAKHSGAGAAKVVFRHGLDSIQLIISDPGCGFDSSQTLPLGGLGLISIRERVRMVGGEVQIHSAPGEGTKIIVLVPSRMQSRKTAGRKATAA